MFLWLRPVFPQQTGLASAFRAPGIDFVPARVNLGAFGVADQTLSGVP